MLKLQHLTKRFGTAPLFTDLCMEVDAPVVLWAPSGWGKTTLLRILMGLERLTTGSVEGVGRVAAVFQEDRLCPQLNAVQNVTLVLPGAENQYKEQIINEFQQLGMDAAALQLPARRLSGGQKRRVALLRALWAPSDTLLLDEPFTGMDPDTLQRAAALLRQRCAGKPVLLATHDESAIRALGWFHCLLTFLLRSRLLLWLSQDIFSAGRAELCLLWSMVCWALSVCPCLQVGQAVFPLS